MTGFIPLSTHALRRALSATALLLLTALALSQINRSFYAQQEQTLLNRRVQIGGLIRRWEEDAAMAEEINGSLEATDMESILAPMKRQAMAEKLEWLAAAARLSSLRYALPPSEPFPPPVDFPNLKDVVQNTLDLEAEAPTDTDCLRFLASLDQLEGRATLDSLTLARKERTSDSSAWGIDNVRLRIRLRWIHNDDHEAGGIKP